MLIFLIRSQKKKKKDWLQDSLEKWAMSSEMSGTKSFVLVTLFLLCPFVSREN